MRLPSGIRLPAFGHNRKSRRDREAAVSEVGASSSRSETQADEKLWASGAVSVRNVDKELTAKKETSHINPNAFFTSPTWETDDQLDLKLSAKPAAKPRDWFKDVDIDTNSTLSDDEDLRQHGILLTDRGGRRSRMPREGATSLSLDSFLSDDDDDDGAVIHGEGTIPRRNTVADTNTAEIDRRRRRRRTYYIMQLNANPFFHASSNGSRYRAWQVNGTEATNGGKDGLHETDDQSLKNGGDKVKEPANKRST